MIKTLLWVCTSEWPPNLVCNSLLMYCHVILFSDTAESSENMEEDDSEDDECNGDDDDTGLSHSSPSSKKQKIQN